MCPSTFTIRVKFRPLPWTVKPWMTGLCRLLPPSSPPTPVTLPFLLSFKDAHSGRLHCLFTWSLLPLKRNFSWSLQVLFYLVIHVWVKKMFSQRNFPLWSIRLTAKKKKKKAFSFKVMIELSLRGWERVIWDVEGKIVKWTLHEEKTARKLPQTYWRLWNLDVCVNEICKPLSF